MIPELLRILIPAFYICLAGMALVFGVQAFLGVGSLVIERIKAPKRQTHPRPVIEEEDGPVFPDAKVIQLPVKK